MVNCTAGTPTLRLCSVVLWSVHWAPSWTTQVLVLARARCCALETCGEKKMRALLLGLAKSIYYLAREREEWIWILLKLELFQASFLFSAGISSLVIPFPSGHGDHDLCILVWCRTATPASFDISFFCLILVQEWRLLLSVCHWRL